MSALRLVMYMILAIITIAVFQGMFDYWRDLYYAKTDPVLSIVVFHTLIIGLLGLAFREIKQSDL